MKLPGSLIAICLAAVHFQAQVKTPQPPPRRVPFAESLQAVVVTVPETRSTTGTARLFERFSPKAKWTERGSEFRVVIGRSGLAWAADSAPDKVKEFKKEGDGRSPAGLFPITYAFGSSTKPEELTFPYVRLEEFTECVDDPASTHYNKIVDRMKVGIFDWKSSEKMLAVGEEYGLGLFVAYNSYPARAGDGSCIFLHVWKNEDSPTSGCTAMARLDLERIVSWLEPGRSPYLVQLTAGDHDRYRKKWNLPVIK